MTDLRITSYNIHSCVGTDGDYSIERVARVLRREGPDIVCLQEVEAVEDNLRTTTNVSNAASARIKTRTWSACHHDNQSARIASLIGHRYHIFVPAIRSRANNKWSEKHYATSDLDISGNFNKKVDATQHTPFDGEANRFSGKFGIALTSKYPILQVRTLRFQRYKHKTLRNALAALVSFPDGTAAWVVNTHLGCHFIGKEQYLQSQQLLTFIDCLEKTIIRLDGSDGVRKVNVAGVIVCGDFNSPPMYRCIREFKMQGFCDSWNAVNGWGATFPSDGRVLGLPSIFGNCRRKVRLLRLDYIFFHRSGLHLACRYSFVDDTHCDCFLASDHLPLCAVFTLCPNQDLNRLHEQ